MATTERDALRAALDALEEIALAGMSGSGQETEEGMRDWHAHRAWEFIGIAARALGPARAALASAPAIEPVSPMAKMAQALRDKAAAEKASFDTRVQSGEWGPAPDAGTEADCQLEHVAQVEGDAVVRTLRWNKNVGAFEYPVGTKLYAASAPLASAPAAPPVEQQAAQAEVAKGILTQLLNARGRKDVLHAQYMGKAMPDEVYDVFHRLRDETIPSLTLQLHEMLAATPPAPTEQPATQAGAAESGHFGGYLCRAWGETELPCAEVVRDLAGVRRFIVREWLNDEAAPDLPDIMADIKARDFKGDGPWQAEFEIGGVSVEPVYSWSAHPTEQPSQDANARRWRWALAGSPEWTYAVCKWDGRDWLPINTEADISELDAARAVQAQGESKGGATNGLCTDTSADRRADPGGLPSLRLAR